MAQPIRDADTEYGTLEDIHSDDPNLTTSTKEISQVIQEGFHCELQDKTALRDVEVSCVICGLVPREPYMAHCCKVRFCQNCIQKQQPGKVNCPWCESANFDVEPDKQLKHKLLKSKVYCKNKDIGCEWIGELSKLDEHLNWNALDGKHFEGCKFEEVSCPIANCSWIKGKLTRGDMLKHYNMKHSESVTSCHDESVASCLIIGTGYEVDMEKYQYFMKKLKRKKLLMESLSKCEGKQTNLKVHTERSLKEKSETDLATDEEIQKSLDELKKIKKRMSECERKQTDLKVQVEDDMRSLKEKSKGLQMESAKNNQEIRRSLDELKKIEKRMSKCEGKQSDFKVHTEDVLKLHGEKLNEHQRQSETLKKLMRTLRDQIGRAEECINQRIGQPIGPVILEMHNYKHYREHGGDWFSSAFYTHRCGYKMCLNVFARGFRKGEGTHISVYLYMMKGEFDETLTWPFHGKITIKLVSREDVGRYTARTIPFNDDIAAATKRVMDKERNSIGCGVETFISHDDVQKYYEKNGSLQFEITKIVID